MRGAGAVEQQPHSSPGGLGDLGFPMASAPNPLPAWQAHCLVSVPGAEVTRGAQPAWAAASLPPSLPSSRQPLPFLAGPCWAPLPKSLHPLCPSHEHRPWVTLWPGHPFWLQGSHGSGRQRSGTVCGCPGAKVTLTGSRCSPGAPQRWASLQRGWGGWQLREWVCRAVGKGRGLGTGGAHAIS